jgi:1-acylglycerone phosphate reductase
MMSEILWMECKPFNINVMLVAPSSIKSNLSTNHATIFELPPGSLYKQYLNNMIRRMYASQQDAMPPDVFAKKVVKSALSPNPPFFSILGNGSFRFKVLRWLPKLLVLTLMWRAFTK